MDWAELVTTLCTWRTPASLIIFVRVAEAPEKWKNTRIQKGKGNLLLSLL